ncbi:diguanylate cyclase [Shewanella atlantica]|uniref:diguanylate cyclase n=1 Tax=Shewanella atlantica TaxID=271099 RepID=UPI003736EAC6
MTDLPTILIVDDSRTNIQLLAGCLKKDYQLKIAMNGQRCLELAQASPQPDLILLDVVMPEMDGYEVCKRLKANPLTQNVPIIFVTGRDSDDEEEYGLQLGAVDYITKPIRPAIVTARVYTQIMLKQKSDELRNMALHDQLTQLYNRHFLLEAANQKIAESVRHNNSLSILMMDIDHFKQVNDQFGHQAGDGVLQAVAQVLAQSNRKGDVVARFGGEEFVAIFEHCSIDSAEAKAEMLRDKIEQLMPVGIHVTGSFGVAELRPDEENFEQLLARADEAVYRAKEMGRNRVERAAIDLSCGE